MGLFKDFATSGYGDFTVGALQGLSEVGQRDAEKNAVFANDSLNKENESMKLTELAFKNKKQITNIIANNPLAFGITESGDLNTSQIADRLTNKIFNEQRTIFESNNFDTVKIGVAKYLTRPGNLGEGITLSNPYIPSEDKFQAEKDKHAAKLSEISKTPRVDKLLMNLETAEQSVPEPEAITDALTKVASITAKGYGILNTFPGTPEGNTNLKFMQTNIIVANARSQFPNNANERNNFITKKLYDNNIDPMAAISFQSPLTYKQITSLLDSQSSALANKILENTNAMAQAQNNEERVQIQNQTNQIIMEQYRLLNTYSQSAGQILSGRDRDMKPPVTVPEEITPPVETPTPDVSEDIEKEGAEPEKAGEIGAFQAKFNFNTIDQKYLVDQWSKKYQGKNTLINRARATKDLFLGSNDMPEEAVEQINQVANAFDGDRGFNKNQISEILSAIGFIESDGYKYKKQGLNKIDDGLGVARSYWQVEPSTAESILDENLNAMKAGKNPLLGPKFETLFKNKYKNVIGNKTALEYFASLNQSQLQDLLLKDGLFAAMIAGHKVISTFDPYDSVEA